MSPGDPTEHQARRAQWLLAAGAAAGIALAMSSLLSVPGGDALPAGVVARVNGVPISERDYERAVAALGSDRRSPLSDDDRRHILDRLIEEELLVQYGASLGLARSDRRIRSDFVFAVLAAQVASVDGTDPGADEAREFFQANSDFFRSPARLWVESLWVAAEPTRSEQEALSRARQASQRLRAGEAFDVVDAEFGDPQVAPVPESALPPAKLREYIGPTGLRAVEALPIGGVSDPVVGQRGARVLLLRARSGGEAPRFEDIETEVRNEMKRRAGDAAVRQLLDDLRREGDVQSADLAP
ncbi:MAG: SurA N-terminal domain-containing protein [Myxococcota bacterium]